MPLPSTEEYLLLKKEVTRLKKSLSDAEQYRTAEMWEKHEAVCRLNQAEEILEWSRSQLQQAGLLLKHKDQELKKAGLEIARLRAEAPRLLQ